MKDSLLERTSKENLRIVANAVSSKNFDKANRSKCLKAIEHLSYKQIVALLPKKDTNCK